MSARVGIRDPRGERVTVEVEDDIPETLRAERGEAHAQGAT